MIEFIPFVDLEPNPILEEMNELKNKNKWDYSF
jgi:hypothetical protein